MTKDSTPSAALDFVCHVERLYAALIRFADTSPEPGAEPALGGKLLYAGELDSHGRALLVAGNIAGAASLAATANPDPQKQSIRDGVADFLVNSLDEALRILKNEIRKRGAVAVCIAAASEVVEMEMRERGVQPDLLLDLQPLATSQSEVLVSWQVASTPVQWLPKVDAIALDCLERTADGDFTVARRWLCLSPRYLGRMAQGIRVMRCDPKTATEFASRVRSAVNRGEIAVEVQICLNPGAD